MIRCTKRLPHNPSWLYTSSPKLFSLRILPSLTLVKNVSNLTIVRLSQWPGPPRVVCKMWRLWLHVKLNVQVAYILFVLLRSDVSAIGWLEANRTTHRLVFCHNKMCLVKIKMNRCEIVLRIKSGFPKINKKLRVLWIKNINFYFYSSFSVYIALDALSNSSKGIPISASLDAIIKVNFYSLANLH